MSNWKNIEQRQVDAKRGRRATRQGRTAVASGIGAIGVGAGLGAIGATKRATDVYRDARRPRTSGMMAWDKSGKMVASDLTTIRGASRKTAGKIASLHLNSKQKLAVGAAAGGAALIAGGVGAVGYGKAKERYSERKIANMRRGRASQIKKSDSFSAFGVDHGSGIAKSAGSYTRDLEGGKTSESRRTVLAAKTPREMKRKGAFLSRHYDSDSPGGYVKPNGKPTPKAEQAARWGEPVPQNAQDAAKLHAKGQRMLASVGKRATVPDVLTPVLPASSVKAYDRSRKNKGRAFTENMGSRFGGSAIGGAVGIGLLALGRKKVPFLLKPSKIAGRTLSAERKYGFAQSAAAGAVGGLAGGAAGNASLKRIKKNPRFEYR